MTVFVDLLSTIVSMFPLAFGYNVIKDVIPIVIKICVFVISTVGPRSGPKWRNLLKPDFSTSLRCAFPWGRLTVEMTQTGAFIK